MARKDLAGLAALGALGMMLSKRKGKDAPTQVEEPGEINERMDRANAISRGRTDLVDTGMSTPEPGGRVRPDENYGNEGRRTGPIAIGKAPVRAAPAGAGSPDPTGGRGVGSRGSLTQEANPGYGGRRFHVEYPEDASAGEARDIAMDKKLGAFDQNSATTYKKGGAVKKMASGGMASSASKRADGIAQKGKTKGRMR